MSPFPQFDFMEHLICGPLFGCLSVLPFFYWQNSEWSLSASRAYFAYFMFYFFHERMITRHVHIFYPAYKRTSVRKRLRAGGVGLQHGVWYNHASQLRSRRYNYGRRICGMAYDDIAESAARDSDNFCNNSEYCARSCN